MMNRCVRRSLTGSLALFGSIAALAAASSARAQLTAVFTGSHSVGAFTDFDYTLHFTNPDGQTKLIPFSSSDPFGHEQGGFVTIYDIRGLSGEAVIAGSGVSTQNTGLNAFNTSPTDDPGLINVTFYYEGLSTIVTDTDLPGFSIRSTFSGQAAGEYTGNYSHTSVTGLPGAAGVQGSVIVPGPVTSSVPEPTSMVLGGAGILSALLIRRRRP